MRNGRGSAHGLGSYASAATTCHGRGSSQQCCYLQPNLHSQPFGPALRFGRLRPAKRDGLRTGAYSGRFPPQPVIVLAYDALAVAGHSGHACIRIRAEFTWLVTVA